MRYKIIFKTLGQLFDEKYYDSEEVIMTEESMQKLLAIQPDDHSWRSKPSSPTRVIEGDTYELAMIEYRKSMCIDYRNERFAKSILSYQELLPEEDIWLWDEYYRSALNGLLANPVVIEDRSELYERIQTCERLARESADRSLKHHRKMTGDLV